MIGLQEAFEKAFICFENTMSVKGIDQAYDIGEYWLFFGRDLPPNEIQYGDASWAVSKENGNGHWFNISVPENYDMFLKKAKPLDIPEKYRLQSHQ